MIQVDNNAIRRMKNHMHEFFSELPIGCILGTNGYIWIHSLCREDETP
jgi:exosome complex RNA-binding protein Rrp4